MTYLSAEIVDLKVLTLIVAALSSILVIIAFKEYRKDKSSSLMLGVTLISLLISAGFTYLTLNSATILKAKANVSDMDVVLEEGFEILSVKEGIYTLRKVVPRGSSLSDFDIDFEVLEDN